MPVYEQSTVGTTTNLITFNDRTADPFFRMTRRYPTKRELREFDIDIPQELGVADYESFIGKTYMVLEGKMYPRSLATYRTGLQALRKLAAVTIEQADSSSDQGYVPFKFPDNNNRQINLKVLYVDAPESSSNGLKLPFRLICKIKYPVVQDQTSLTANTGSSTATLTGTPLSWVLPKVVGASTYSSSGSITNTGDLPSWPSIVINGPINIPRLTNTTTGEYIEINVNLLTSSDSIIINYDQDTVSITQAGTTVYGSLTSGSTLFKIKTGVNNFTLTGSTVGSNAYATVSTFPIYPLS